MYANDHFSSWLKGKQMFKLFKVVKEIITMFTYLKSTEKKSCFKLQFFFPKEKKTV